MTPSKHCDNKGADSSTSSTRSSAPSNRTLKKRRPSQSKDQQLTQSSDDPSDEVHEMVVRRLRHSFQRIPKRIVRLRKYNWRNLNIPTFVFMIGSHLLALWSLVRIFQGRVGWKAIVYQLLCNMIACIGITAGYHRFYAHKTYKASPIVRVILMLMGTSACQQSILKWSHNHRSHHRNSETPADPHDAKKGFFYSHIGWLLEKEPPAVTEAREKLDCADLRSSRMVVWQYENYAVIAVIVTLVVPMSVSRFLLREGWLDCYLLCMLRIIVTLNSTWLVNSLAHYWGERPYDATIFPVQNALVNFLTFGEGNHNYHHSFPLDYRASDRMKWAKRIFMNPTQVFIDVLAAMGLAWDLRITPPKTVTNRALTRGFQALSAATY